MNTTHWKTIKLHAAKLIGCFNLYLSVALEKCLSVVSSQRQNRIPSWLKAYVYELNAKEKKEHCSSPFLLMS